MELKRILALLLTISISMTIVPCFMLTANAANGSTQMSIVGKVGGDSTASDSLSNGSEAVTFIVEVEGDPLAIQSGIAAMSDNEKTEEILAKQEKVMTRIQNKVDTNAQKGFVYTAVFNGFSMEGTIDQIDEIKALDGVKNVYISSRVQVIEPVDDDMEVTLLLDSAGEISGTSAAYDSGYNGEGTVIAIIDSGCDTAHDFFKADIQNPRYSKEEIDNLVKTLPLNADAESGNQVYKNEKIPYAYNYSEKSADTYIHSLSHGTHVAGIAAGKDGIAPDGSLFSGIAPEAQLLILSCADHDKYLNQDAILAALNDAVLMGADVINMSFGTDYADVLYTDVYREIFENCREAGVSLIAGSGNSTRGYKEIVPTTDRPDYGSLGVPAGESIVTSVAAVYNNDEWYEFLGLEARDGTVYEAYSANAADPFEEGSYLEYVDCGLGYPEQFQNVSGKLALIKRGELTFVQKANNAKNAGAVGIIIYNNTEGIFSTVELGLPALILTLDEGTKLLERKDKELRYIGTQMRKKETLDSGLITDYSSWGVGANLELKPEISAPGRKIYSSIPDNKYKAVGGTSMASPHIAGITALTHQYYKTNPFADEFNGKTGKEMTCLIENLIMNSATIIKQKNGVPYSPRVQGAGLVNVEGILKSRVLLTGDSGKAKLNLGDDLTDTLKLEFDITNIGEEEIVFDKITIDVLTDGYEESEGGYLVSESVAVETVPVSIPESVTVSSGETVTFKAELRIDADFIEKNKEIFRNGFYIDGYVILESEVDADLKASLPFTGFYGDWGQAPIFDSTIYDEGGSYFADPDSETETGTYLAVDYNSKRIPLGRNRFFPEIIDKKYIAYSKNGRSSLKFIMTNFRAFENPVMSIVNSGGKTVFSEKVEAVQPKFYEHGISCAYDVFSDLEEGLYTVNVKAKVLGNTDATDELSIPFTIDNTYPEILSAVYDENAKTVTVKAKENHYFSAFYIVYPEDSEEKYEYIQVFDEDYANDRSVTKVIDVSMIEDISEAEIGCVDYALNQSQYDMDYFMDKVGAELTSCVRFKNMTQAEFTIKNNTSEELSADFLLAFYDDNDCLISTSIKKYKIGANAEEELTYALFENTLNASYVKLFVWDFLKLNPVDMPKQFTLNN